MASFWSEWRALAGRSFFNIFEVELQSFLDPKCQIQLMVKTYSALHAIYTQVGEISVAAGSVSTKQAASIFRLPS